MSYREFHYQWAWRLKASPAALWPLVSDTNRFNRDTGVPAVEVRDEAAGLPLPNGRRWLRLYRLGMPVEWEEEPFEWVRPYRFGVVRRYTRGPVAEMRVLAELTPQPDGGTRLVYHVWARPKNLLGLPAIPAQIGVLSARSFDATFRRYDLAAARARPEHLPAVLSLPSAPRLAPGGPERLRAAREALLDRGASPELVGLLATLIQEADDLALFRMRPYALAEFWEQPRRAVLELCLLATRVGLLNFRWDVLCPLCRGTRQVRSALSEVREQVHCESCHIDYSANFDRQVELTFRPNPGIRPTPESTYCVGGPQVTPHIVAQQLLVPAAEREFRLPLEAGRYRLRAAGLPGGQFLVVAPGAADAAIFSASDQGWPPGETRLAPEALQIWRNASAHEQLLILERVAWSDQAVTAAEVTALQMFRDLFANEALRPGERISVGSVTVLFTDLRESTRLYRQSGDAVAFGRVMSHFDVLREAIAAEGGALVKTIGDSVMAVFTRPVAALRAVMRAQAALAHPPEGLPPLRLKAGVHTGPCVAVTLNDRLDYFGTTVNIAARLEGLTTAGTSVVASAAVMNDQEVAAWRAAGGAWAEPFAATLKGYEDERFQLWALAPLEGSPLARAAPDPAREGAAAPVSPHR
jgi:class 3 adenylate cyclase